MGFGGDFLLRWFGSSFSPAFLNFKLTLGHFVYAVKGNLLQGLLPAKEKDETHVGNDHQQVYLHQGEVAPAHPDWERGGREGH